MLALEIQQLITNFKKSGINYASMTAADARALNHSLASKRPCIVNPPATQIETQTIALPGREIKLRIYKPAALAEQTLPVIFYFHSGGFVWGLPEFFDDPCSLLADATRTAIISIDYRYAPEFPFPAALNDCYESMLHVLQRAKQFNIDANKIAVAGDSAGGTIAAGICLRARDAQALNIRAQLLIYPWLDCNFDSQSYHEMGQDYILTTEAMQWFTHHYLLKPEDKNNPLALPANTKDLSNLPPALVITAKYDVLHDEGKIYAERLQAAGNQTQYICYENMSHSFVGYGGFCPAARHATGEIAARFACLLTSLH